MVTRIGWAAVLGGTLTLASIAAADPPSPLPPGTGSTFSEAEAKKELMAARVRATDCSRVSGVTGSGKLKLSIGNSGQVTDIVMISVPPKMDEKTDQCVRAEFNKLKVTPFEGNTVNVTGLFVLM